MRRIGCFSLFVLRYLSLSMVGVEHNSEGCSHSLGWQVLGKPCSHKSTVAVCFRHSAPDNSIFSVLLESFGLEDVSDFLSEVETCCFLIIGSLDLEESVLFILVSLASLEAHECCLLVQSTETCQTLNKTYLTG